MGIGRLGKNTLLSTIGLVVRALIQAAYLVVLSRWMGPNGYGLFAGSVAAAILLSPLSGWGISYVLTRDVSRDHVKSHSLWATAIIQIALSGLILIVLVIFVSDHFLVTRVNSGSMLILGFSELIAVPLAQAATCMCLALDRGLSAAFAMCIIPASRFIAVATFMTVGLSGSPHHVAALHFLGSIFGASLAFYAVSRIDGAPDWRRRMRLIKATSDGTHYATGALVGSSYQEVDKVLLLQILGSTSVGTYTAAFRVMSVFVLPIAALMGAALPRLFAEQKADGRHRVLRVVTFSAIGYALVASLAAAIVSPVMPFIFGSGFTASSSYLLMLSPWAIIFALHQSGATGLTAQNRQVTRVVVEAIGLLCVIGMNLLLLQSLGVRAAVLSLLTAEVFMASACWLMLYYFQGRAKLN
jgi:O-antigen/teichoic acid export membrane protein